MVRSRSVVLLALAASVTVPTLARAQGLPRYQRRQANAPRLMVATPYAFAAADSAAAVGIGDGMRDRMERIAGSDYLVIPDSIMNDALLQYGYAKDAILTPQLALTLAKQLQSRVVVTSQMARLEGGRFRVQARLVGTSDDAGATITIAQNAGQRIDAFGEAISERLAPALKSYDEARECMSLRQQKPMKADKVTEAASKALKTYPQNGLAHLCLAQLVAEQQGPKEEVIRHLEAAVEGDSLSLIALSQLATRYEEVSDSAKLKATFGHMLRVAPTNQKLREEIFKKLLALGEANFARQVADDGLAQDPYNFDLYDLKSNACLFASDFKCAVDALEQAFAIDSTKADTLFFTKISVAAAQRPDTARLLKWAGNGVRKFPDNVTLLGYLNQGLVLAGMADSSIAVTRTLMKLDTSAVVPALAAAQGLIGKGRYADAEEFVAFAEKRGDAQQKQQLALMLVNGATPLLQQQKDRAALQQAAALAQRGIALGSGNPRLAAVGNYVLGLATYLQIPIVDPEAERTKSCELARQEEQLLTDAEAALTAGKSAQPEAATQYLGVVTQYKPRAASMVRAYCK